MNMTTNTETAIAKSLHTKLASIDVATIQRNATLERSCPRKELAAAARKLFRSLGLNDISVTSPNYSMAQSVDVRLPRREDYSFDAGGDVIEGDEARAANNASYEKIALILHTAFPSHRDRNDLQSDYFDFKWSIN